jgi:hypothetical protein
MTSIQSVMEKYEDQLMQRRNVHGVGIGQKGAKQVIKVFVTHKVDKSALKPGDLIPKILDGYETDVEEIGSVSAQTSPPSAEE